MKKLLATLFCVLLVLNVLAPAVFAEGEEAESEESTTTVTEGTVGDDGTLHFEFETLAKDAGDTNNILRDVALTGNQPCTKSADGNTVYASENALWGTSTTSNDPSTALSFKAENAGYYKVKYAVGNINGDPTNLSKMTFAVNGVTIGDNDGKNGNNTVLDDLTVYGDNVQIYPWKYEKMALFQGTVFCYLTEDTNTLAVNITKTGGNVVGYKFFADYIEFVPVEGSVKTTQVSTGDYMARITPECGIPLQANAPLSFDFTVPTDGDYAFMAKRDVIYTDDTGITVTVKEKNSESGEAKTGSTKWTHYKWAVNKNYARMNMTPLKLTANTAYTLTATATKVVAVYYFDIIRTNIDVDGKIVVPGQFYTSTTETDDHALHCKDSRVDANTYISENFSDYSVIGSPQSESLSDKLGNTSVGNSLTKQKYHEYTLNIPDDGSYVFNLYVDSYVSTGDPLKELVYFSVDGKGETAVEYSPNGSTDKARILTYKTDITAGTHTLKIARKAQEAPYGENNNLYMPFFTAERVSSAIMYEGESLTSDHVITSLQDGTVSVRIKNHNYELIEQGERVMAFFAIYDSTNQMVGVASYIGEPSGDTIDLTIKDFNMEAGKTYTAKAFLWNDKLQGTCFELGSTSSN